MQPKSHATTAMPQQAWFLALLAAYAVLQLSFNHRLLELAGGAMSEAVAAQLHDMERWARLVSSLGLALLLMRALHRRLASRLWLVLVSTALGVLVMWPLQKWVVDEIVARAGHIDMVMSVQSHLSTAEALKGRMELRGLPVLPGPVPPDLRPVMGALWSSSVLGLAPDDLDATSGVAQLAGHWMAIAPSEVQMRDAYRKAVMTPVALGASLWFGMLNLCQLFAGMGLWGLSRLGALRWQTLAERWLLPACLVLCTTLSWWSGNVWVESPAYSQVARPALWHSKPFLAPFVDWSLRAEPAWSDPVAWVHHTLLQDFEFRSTWPLTFSAALP